MIQRHHVQVEAPAHPESEGTIQRQVTPAQRNGLFPVYKEMDRIGLGTDLTHGLHNRVAAPRRFSLAFPLCVGAAPGLFSSQSCSVPGTPISAVIRQPPSGCFFQTVTYRPPMVRVGTPGGV